MPVSPYIINALIAAALGAGTNELAIITILRYILPRKKNEIARRIQDLIATDLLSPEKMKQKLSDPHFGALLQKNIDSALTDLFSRDLPPPNLLLANHQDELHALSHKLRQTLIDEFTTHVRSPNFLPNTLRPFLAERWDALRTRTPRSLMTQNAEKLPDFARAWIASLHQSPALRDNVAKALDNWLANRIADAASPADILSPGLVAAAEELAVSQAPAIVEQLTNMLREKDVSNTIAAGIMNAIHSQLRGQGVLGEIKGVFVSAMGVRNDVRGVCRRLPDELEANFRRPFNRERLVLAIRAAVRKGLGQELQDEFKTPGQRSRIVSMLMSGFWQPEIFERLGGRMADFVETSLSSSLEETLLRLGVDGSREEILDEAALRCQRILAADATVSLIERQFDELLDAWRRRPLGRLDRFIGPHARNRLAKAAAKEGRNMIQSRLSEFAEESGVWDIITDSIEGYDNKKLSDMVVQLARSELRWVTILGGFIGMVVGILQTAIHQLGLY